MIDTADLKPATWAAAGDLVITRKGDLFRITSVKQVNFGVVDEDGKRWNLRKTGAFLAPEGTVFGGPDAEAPKARATTTTYRPPSTTMHPGTVVFITGGKFASKTQKYVVLRDNGDTVSATKLNATDGGRYIRGCSKSFLEVTTAS